MIKGIAEDVLRRVYDFSEMTNEELRCKFFQKLEECINQCNTITEVVEFLKNEGLENEVNEVLTQWKNDGSLAEIINVDLFNNLKTELTNKFDNDIDYNMALSEVKNFCMKLKTNTKTINFIGDSISHGVGASTTFNDSWVGIMRKFLNEEFNKVNYGYVSLNTKESGHTWFGDDIIDVVRIGTWNETNPNGAVTGGYNIYSSTVGDKLQIKVKKDCKYIRIYYEKNIDGGNFDVSLNGTVKTTISSSASDIAVGLTDLISTEQYPALFDLDITVKSGRVSICGIQLIDDLNDYLINNFSKAGIALQQIHNPILWEYFNADVVFFSLGHNDCYSMKNLDGFKGYINQCIQIINNYNPFVIVTDFLWYENEESEYRKELKRLCNSIKKSIYIPFPDKVPFTNMAEAIESGFLVDFSHPSDKGHQMIAETVAKAVGLSITSKDSVIKLENKVDYASVRNLVLNSSNVYIGNESLLENTTVNFNYINSISNLISQKTITFTMDVEIDIDCKDNTNFGIDTRIEFIDGTEMWIGINRHRPLEQGYDITNAWKAGRYKGQISKTFKLPNKQISAIDNACLFVNNVNGASRVYVSNVMVSVGEKIVGWLPAFEDLEARITALEAKTTNN